VFAAVVAKKKRIEYLTKKTGENVAVQALVVLPGWFVEQGKGNFNVKAMNAAYLAGFLRREDEKLEAGQVRRIIAAPPVHHSWATVDVHHLVHRSSAMWNEVGSRPTVALSSILSRRNQM
jgi:hypothetical protein